LGRKFIVLLFSNSCCCYEIGEDEMGGACSINWWIESCKTLSCITNRDMKCAYNILFGKFGGKRDSEEEGCNSMDVPRTVVRGEDWVELAAQVRVQCLAFVNIMNRIVCHRGLRISRAAEELSAFQQSCCVTL
jgi:hypothetical protein